MPFPAVCPQCGFSRQVEDSLRLRKAKCPKCSTVFVIGSTAAPEAATAASLVKKLPPPPPPLPPPLPNKLPVKKKIPNPLQSGGGAVLLCPTLQNRDEFNRYRAMLLKPLQTPLESRKLSFGYKFGLFLTALFMVLLPIVYIGLIAGLCYLEYEFFMAVGRGAWEYKNKGGIMVLIGIPAALGIIIVVLVRPLIGGWGGKDTRFQITREREPLLFDFVQHLCEFVGAPMPERIFVTCQVNASAGMTRGIWGAVFGGNACDLTIGLPLVAGLKTSEFAHVLAHEFGHFTQAGTRRMDYIVQTVLAWFAHIYYYRDSLDKALVAASSWGQIGFICFFIRFCIWLIRRLIWILMTLGRFVAGFMSRQMEYDADTFANRLVGSSRFVTASKQILKLSIANDKATSDINYMLNEDRLPDNYPLLIAANMKILDEELDRITAEIIQTGKTGFNDTHPCDADRIAASEAMSEPGVLHVDLPSTLLFRNFTALSREVSLDFYQNVAELKFEPEMLKNASTVIDQLRRENQGNDAVIQLFQRAYIQDRFLSFSGLTIPADSRSAGLQLRKARETQESLALEASEAVKEYGNAERKYLQAFVARELVRLNIKVDMPQADFKFKTLGEASQGAELFEAQFTALAARFSGRDAAVAERLFCAKELLRNLKIQEQIEDGAELHQRMETVLPILEKFGKMSSEFHQARRNFAAALTWAERLQALSQDKAASLYRSIEEGVDLVRRTTKNYQTVFSDTPYPFEHHKQETTLGTFLVPEWNETEWGIFDYYHAFGLLSSRLVTTYHLVLGESAAITLAVEQVLGLQPLPVPPPP